MSLKLRLFTETEKHWGITFSTPAYTPKFSEFGKKPQKKVGAGPVLALGITLSKYRKNEEKWLKIDTLTDFQLKDWR